MIGLPFEQEEDILAIPDTVKEIILIAKDIMPKNKIGRLNINLSINAFCPKPFTPFQWVAQDSIESLNEKFLIIKNKLPKRYVTVSWSNPQKSKIECALSRGNLKVADAVEDAFKSGAKFDNWSEFFNFDIWQKSFEKSKINLDFFTDRNFDINEILPWDFIDINISKKFLQNEFKKAQDIAVKQ